MIAKVAAVGQALLVTILVGAALVASFYFAYVLILLLVLASVGILAYLFFAREEEEKDWFDFSD